EDEIQRLLAFLAGYTESTFEQPVPQEFAEVRAWHRTNEPQPAQAIERPCRIHRHGGQQSCLGSCQHVSSPFVSLNCGSNLCFRCPSRDVNHFLELIDNEPYGPSFRLSFR